MQRVTGIQQACDKLGGQEPLGAALDVTQQAVSLWVKQGYAPLERVPMIAELTGIKKRALCDPQLVSLIED